MDAEKATHDASLAMLWHGQTGSNVESCKATHRTELVAQEAQQKQQLSTRGVYLRHYPGFLRGLCLDPRNLQAAPLVQQPHPLPFRLSPPVPFFPYRSRQVEKQATALESLLAAAPLRLLTLALSPAQKIGAAQA